MSYLQWETSNKWKLTPIISSKVIARWSDVLENFILHYSHRDVSDLFEKTKTESLDTNGTNIWFLTKKPFLNIFYLNRNLEEDGYPLKGNLFGHSALLMNAMYIAFP